MVVEFAESRGALITLACLSGEESGRDSATDIAVVCGGRRRMTGVAS